jgi:hypothetical protein
VVGETTRAVAPQWAAVELNRIAVKGKTEAVAVAALLGDSESMCAARLRASRRSALPYALAYYRAQDWAGAFVAIGECRDTTSASRGSTTSSRLLKKDCRICLL